MTSAKRWATQCFGSAQLGDVRRTNRLVRIAERVALSPAGRVTEVFPQSASRQAAYDFLEHDWVPTEAVAEAVFVSTVRETRDEERVFVAVDGTSLTLVDERGTKGFGRLGNLCKGGHGLKVINALALDSDGVPLGVAEQVWWSRLKRADRSRLRPLVERESLYWQEATNGVIQRFATHAPETKLHFLVDREGDATFLITSLLASGHEFTIRSNARRKVAVGTQRRDLRGVLRRLLPLARMDVALPQTETRDARVACLEIRAATLPIIWRDRHTQVRQVAPVTVIWARERSRRATRVEWVLFSNVPIATAADACAAVRRYRLRWRIEDFHKSWKSGVCRVEDTQLRSKNAVIKWATILGAVAARAERLRHRARVEPDAPATEELSSDEIDALVLLKNQDCRRPVAVSDNLSIKQATRWIADLGGYVGARGSGLPGTTTIMRGLERVLLGAELIANLRAAGRLR